jgi:hypothetical protein
MRLHGTRVGFDGGCSMKSITAVTSSLQTLAAEHWAHTITSTPAVNDLIVAAETGAWNATACGSSGGSAELEAAVVPGQSAIDNQAQRVRQALERQIACLGSADPWLQANILMQQASALLHLEHHVATSRCGIQPAQQFPSLVMQLHRQEGYAQALN